MSIYICKEKVEGWEYAVDGIRASYSSWDKIDSDFDIHGSNECVALGSNDLERMKSLAKAGGSESKFMRSIIIWAHITAPMYWWKECDTYKVGTVRQSESTMHTIMRKPFELKDFSHENLLGTDAALFPIVNIDGKPALFSPKGLLAVKIKSLNELRELYLNEKDPEMKAMYWHNVIQLLPSSYNQMSVYTFNYEVAAKMYRERKNHKLGEWRDFCKWLETLPYAKELIVER